VRRGYIDCCGLRAALRQQLLQAQAAGVHTDPASVSSWDHRPMIAMTHHPAAPVAYQGVEAAMAAQSTAATANASDRDEHYSPEHLSSPPPATPALPRYVATSGTNLSDLQQADMSMQPHRKEIKASKRCVRRSRSRPDSRPGTALTTASRPGPAPGHPLPPVKAPERHANSTASEVQTYDISPPCSITCV
jgi:hypothetical protein